MIRLGVLGWPVAHSRSPAMQNAALAAVGLGQGWRYQLLPVPPDRFEETVRALPAAGFRGVNVTIPHKHAALTLATEPTERARAIGAANTLLFGDDGCSIAADNTDAPALVQALQGHREVSGCTALVLGAGGSARAAVWALLDAGAGEVRVWNRTVERAHALCADLGGAPVAAGAQAGAPAQVLVNCTSVGLHDEAGLDELLPLKLGQPVGAYEVVVDFVYAGAPSPLLQAAAAAGVATVNGLELLVGQGALSFEQFTGVPAPIDAMRAAVGL